MPNITKRKKLEEFRGLNPYLILYWRSSGTSDTRYLARIMAPVTQVWKSTTKRRRKKQMYQKVSL